ncbi:Foldase protein PrsA 2 precursor [Gimesia panareensis]|uniref:Foldase protein PrsA 2 n=1 Tax=Gimesia panareensis TaxID=2527978 RepID=A0A517QCR7_9PLAN|nr:peptidylprolyl isomerase [Gimesia panareensis]QDT29422.1 Foldase protein PrsA 2 precursor [Gimesia panareensis]
MRHAQIYLLILALPGMMGCETTPKVDNPVLGPPPPRLESALKQQKLEESAVASHARDRKNLLEGDFAESDNPFETPVITASTTSDEIASSAVAEPVEDLQDSTVVAMVNGMPLFVSDILGVYDFQLRQAEQRMEPDEYQKLRRALVKRDLKGHVERLLLLHEMKTTLKKEQLDMLNQHLETAFEDQRIPELQKQMGVNSPQELEDKLNEQGRSLIFEKEQFMKQQSAIQFMAVRAKAKDSFSREEVLARYRSHIKDYEVPAKVQWQRIRITYSKHGGKDKAIAVLDEVIHKLQSGADFGEIAKQYSDGTRADKNGSWGWTRSGSLAEPEVEEALFSLPIGEVSQVFETDTSFQIVKVNGRKQAGHIPFADVQGKLEQKMISESRMKSTTKLLDELYAKAIIESEYKIEKGQDVNPANGKSAAN